MLTASAVPTENFTVKPGFQSRDAQRGARRANTAEARVFRVDMARAYLAAVDDNAQHS